MRIIMVGGSGILSSAVVDECIRLGYEVTIMNRGRNKAFINPKAKLIKCDVYNEQIVRETLQGLHYDVFIDFLVKTMPQLKYSLNMFSNIAHQYVFISSAQAYNTTIKGVLKEDSELTMPLWSYSVNKAKCEKYLQEYAKEKNIKYTIIRPGVNYDNRRIPYGIFPLIGMHWTIAARILAGKPIITWNGGQNKLNLTRVEDFASGMVGLLGETKAYNEAFNVVGDNVYTWKEALDTLGDILGVKVNTVDITVDFYANELTGDDKEALLGGRSQDLWCSNEKMKKLVPNFKTQYNLKEGMQLTVDFYKKNKYYDGIDYRWDGDTDRIINKYYHSVGKKKDKSLCFVQYINSPNSVVLEGKKTYHKSYTKDVLFWRGVRKIQRILESILN